MKQMFLNLSVYEEENTFLPSLKQILISDTLLHSKTVVYKQGDSPGYLTEKIETENQITTKISVPPHVILALVQMCKWTTEGNTASKIIATTLPSLAGSL